MHEMKRATSIALSDELTRHKLRVGVNRDPRPSIAAALRLLLCGAVPILRINKRPDFVALDSLTGKVAKDFVLVTGNSRDQDRKVISLSSCAARRSCGSQHEWNCPRPT